MIFWRLTLMSENTDILPMFKTSWHLSRAAARAQRVSEPSYKQFSIDKFDIPLRNSTEFVIWLNQCCTRAHT
jgi:hypothetical protein